MQIRLEHMVGNPANVPDNQLWGAEPGPANEQAPVTPRTTQRWRRPRQGGATVTTPPGRAAASQRGHWPYQAPVNSE